MPADLSTASTVADITTRLPQAAGRELGRRWPDFLASLVQRLGVRLGLEADPGTGLILPSLDVSLRQAPLEEQRATLAGALDAIEQVAAAKRAHVGVILDEFQEIHRFGGEAAEAHLRGVIQHHRRVSYVLAGSDERLIQAMTGRGRPFYKLLEPLRFGAMARRIWRRGLTCGCVGPVSGARGSARRWLPSLGRARATSCSSRARYSTRGARAGWRTGPRWRRPSERWWLPRRRRCVLSGRA